VRQPGHGPGCSVAKHEHGLALRLQAQLLVGRYYARAAHVTLALVSACFRTVTATRLRKVALRPRGVDRAETCRRYDDRGAGEPRISSRHFLSLRQARSAILYSNCLELGINGVQRTDARFWLSKSASFSLARGRMAKVGTRATPRRTTSDRKQSERLKTTARRLNANEMSKIFELAFRKLAPRSVPATSSRTAPKPR
jgi:hypothetical protein